MLSGRVREAMSRTQATSFGWRACGGERKDEASDDAGSEAFMRPGSGRQRRNRRAGQMGKITLAPRRVRRKRGAHGEIGQATGPPARSDAVICRCKTG